MKKGLAVIIFIGMVSIFLSGCGTGKITLLDQPGTYQPNMAFDVKIQADPVFWLWAGLPEKGAAIPYDDFSSTMPTIRIPVVSILMPESWEILSCSASGYPLVNGTAQAGPVALSDPPADNPLEEPPPGYEWKPYALPSGLFWTSGAEPYPTVEATCNILPKAPCGPHTLSYLVALQEDLNPPDSEDAVPIEQVEEGVPLMSLNDYVFSEYVESREIDCTENVPTVNEWGIIVMSTFLAGVAVWAIRRRKKIG